MPQGRPDLGVAGEGGDAAGVPDHGEDGLQEGAQPAAGGAVSVGAAAPSVSGRRRRQCRGGGAVSVNPTQHHGTFGMLRTWIDWAVSPVPLLSPYLYSPSAVMMNTGVCV